MPLPGVPFHYWINERWQIETQQEKRGDELVGSWWGRKKFFILSFSPFTYVLRICAFCLLQLVIVWCSSLSLLLWLTLESRKGDVSFGLASMCNSSIKARTLHSLSLSSSIQLSHSVCVSSSFLPLLLVLLMWVSLQCEGTNARVNVFLSLWHIATLFPLSV